MLPRSKTIALLSEIIFTAIAAADAAAGVNDTPVFDRYGALVRVAVMLPGFAAIIFSLLLLIKNKTIRLETAKQEKIRSGLVEVRQKEAQRALLETQQFNESVMRATLDMVYIYDFANDGIVYTNPHFSELLGYPDSEVRAMGGRFHERLIHPEDLLSVTGMLSRWDENDDTGAKCVEMRMRDAVGRWHWFQGRYIAFKRGESGQVTQVIGTLHDITERVTVENALKIAFERAQRYLDIVEAIIVALDREGRVTLINRKGAQVLGLDTPDIIGKKWFEIFVPSDERFETSRFFEMLIAGDIETVEYHENTIVTVSGEERVIAWHNSIVRDDRGEIIGTLSSGEDITDRRRAESLVNLEKLRQNIIITLGQMPAPSIEYVLDYALDTALVLTKSVTGYLLFYDERTKKVSLYGRTGGADQNCHVDPYAEMDNMECAGLWGEAVRRRQPVITNNYHGESPWKKGLPHGHIPINRHLNIPVFDGGDIVAIIGVANKESLYDENDVRHLQLLMDGVWKIKKRIEMEAQVRSLNEELEQKVEVRTEEVKRAHEELSRFFTLSLDLLAIFDSQGNIVRCNTAFEKVLGYKVDCLKGKAFIDLVHQDDTSATRTLIDRCRQERGVTGFVNRCRRGDGEFRWIEWRAIMVDRQVYAAARDITDKKEDEAALIRAKEEADRANLAKSRFLANISHEIRTPLNAVIGYSELLAATAANEKEQSYVESITLAGRNLLRLINDILDLSKIEADMMTIRYGTVDLCAMVRETGRIFSFQLSRKGLSFEVKTDPALPRYLVLDEARMRQILLNIVGNAVKFTDDGGITAEISFVSSPDKPGKIDLAIAVEDSGAGIPVERRAGIFEAFHQQVDQPRSYGGTGLGLSISKKLVEMMHGSIEVRDGRESGSCFVIRLPAVEVSSAAPGGEEPDDAFFEAEPEDALPGLPPEYSKKAGDLLGAVKMDDVRTFAQELTAFGSGSNLYAIKKSGIKLAQHADHFDIVGVRSILRRLAGISH